MADFDFSGFDARMQELPLKLDASSIAELKKEISGLFDSISKQGSNVSEELKNQFSQATNSAVNAVDSIVKDLNSKLLSETEKYAKKSSAMAYASQGKTTPSQMKDVRALNSEQTALNNSISETRQLLAEVTQLQSTLASKKGSASVAQEISGDQVSVLQGYADAINTLKKSIYSKGFNKDTFLNELPKLAQVFTQMNEEMGEAGKAHLGSYEDFVNELIRKVNSDLDATRKNIEANNSRLFTSKTSAEGSFFGKKKEDTKANAVASKNIEETQSLKDYVATLQTLYSLKDQPVVPQASNVGAYSSSLGEAESGTRNVASATQEETQAVIASTEAHNAHAEAVRRDAEAENNASTATNSQTVRMDIGDQTQGASTVSTNDAVDSAIRTVTEDARVMSETAVSASRDAVRASTDVADSQRRVTEETEASTRAWDNSQSVGANVMRNIGAMYPGVIQQSEELRNSVEREIQARNELQANTASLPSSGAEVVQNAQLAQAQSVGAEVMQRLNAMYPEVTAQANALRGAREREAEATHQATVAENEHTEAVANATATNNASNNGYRSFSQWAPDISAQAEAQREQNRRIAEQEEALRRANELSANTNTQIHNPEFTSLQELEERINIVNSMIGQIRARSQGGNLIDVTQNVNDIRILEEELRRLEGMRNSLTGGANAEPIFYESINSARELDGVIQQLKEQIASTRSNLQNGGSTDFEGDIQRLREYEKALKELEGHKKLIDGQEQGPQAMNYSQLLDAIKEKKREIVNAKWELGKSGDVQADVERLKTLEKELKNLEQLKATVQQSTPKGMLGSMFHDLGSKVGHGMLNAVKNVIPASVSMIKSAFTGLAHVTMGIGKGLFNGAVSGAKMATNALVSLGKIGFNAMKNGITRSINGVKSLVSHVKSFVKKHTPNLMKSLKSIKSMLMRRLKRTFISSIFNQAKQGLQGLAIYSESFNQAMSNIKNTSKETAGNLAVSMGRLLEIIQPALETVLGWLNSLLKGFNSFIALITGKSTVTVAKKQTDDYAKSLQKASGAAKELNSQLYGFDEITRQDSNNGGGSGSGSSSDSGFTQFEEQDIESVIGGNLKQTFEDIISAFKGGQFEEAGKLAGGLVNSIIDNLDTKVNELRTKGVQWSSNIARVLNGLVDSIDFGKAGKLVGDSITAAFDIVDTFFDTFDFNKYGTKVAEFINGLSIDFALVGDTVASGFNGIIHYVEGLVSNLDFGQIGSNFATSISTFFSTLDFDGASDALSNGINGIILTFHNLLTGVNWVEIRSKLQNSVLNAVTKINWNGEGGVIPTITTHINGMIESFMNLVSDPRLSQIAGDLGEAVGGFLANVDWVGLASAIRRGIGTAANAFKNFTSRMDIPRVASRIAKGLNSMFSEGGKEEFKKTISDITKGVNNIIAGFKSLITGENAIDFSGIAQTIGEGINQFITETNFDDLVGVIGIGAGKLVKAFGDLVSSIFKTTIDPVTGEETNLGTKLADGINQVFTKDDMFKSMGKSIGDAIRNVFNNLSSFVSKIEWASLLQSIFDAFKEMFSSVFGSDENGRSLGTVFADAINNIFGSLKADKTKLESVGKSISSMFIDAIGAIKDFIEEIDLGAIVDSLVTLLSSIDWGPIAQNLISLIGSALGKMVEGLGDLIEGIVKLVGTLDWGEIATGIVEGIVKGFEKLIEGGFNAADTILRAIFGDDIMNKVAEFVGDVGDKAKGTFEEAKNNNTSAGRNLNLIGKIVGGGKKSDAEPEPEDIPIHDEDYYRDAYEKDKIGAYRLILELLGANVDTVKAYRKILEDTIFPVLDSADFDSWSYEAKEKLINSLLYAFDKKDQSPQRLQEVITNWLSETGMIEYIPQITIGDVETPDTEEVAKQMSESINLMTKAWDDAVQNGRKRNAISINGFLHSYLGDSFASLSQGFKDMLSKQNTEDIHDALALFGAGISEEMLTAINIEGLHERLGKWMEETGTSYEAIIADNMTAVKAVLSSMGTDASVQLLNALNDANVASDLQKWMQESGASLDETIVYLMALMGDDVANVAGIVGEDVGDKLGSQIPDSLKKALKVGEKEVKKASEELTEAAKQSTSQLNDVNENSKETGKKAVGGFVSQLAEEKSTVSDASEGTVDAVEEKFKALPEDVQPYAKQMLEYISTAITEGDGTVLNAIEKLATSVVTKVETTLSGEKGAEITKAFLDGLKNGVTSNHDGVVSLIQTTASSALSSSTNYMNSSTGRMIGSNLLIGMINGVNAYGQMLVDAIATICSCTVETARDILGIESPSKVFAEIGGYVMEGMENGINGNGQDALNAIASIANAIIDEGSVDLTVGAMSDGLDTVESKMSRIAQIFSDIASTITEMGGFEIPTVASGRVIPYRAKVDTEPVDVRSENAITDRNDLEDAFYSAFMRAMSNMDNRQNVNVYLDGREISDVVNKYQRQQSRAWGV